MPETSEDPVDHNRTARRFTGETMKNTRTSPGLALGALGLLAIVCALYLFALGYLAAGALAALVALAVGTAGLLWILAEHRRVVRHEVQWLAEHPHVVPEQPTG